MTKHIRIESRRNKITIHFAIEEKNNVKTEKENKENRLFNIKWSFHLYSTTKWNICVQRNTMTTAEEIQEIGYSGWRQGLAHGLKHPVKSRYMKKVSSATTVPWQPISVADGGLKWQEVTDELCINTLDVRYCLTTWYLLSWLIPWRSTAMFVTAHWQQWQS